VEVQPYLMFEGRCEEAIEFYRRAVGAEVQFLMRYKEMPEPRPPGVVTPANAEKIMHANLRIGQSTVLASDGQCQGQPHVQGFALSLTVADEAEAERRFDALADGGQVRMPLAKTFFSPRFGMLADRFGVAWMVYVAP
jgi:PhnB protein